MKLQTILKAFVLIAIPALFFVSCEEDDTTINPGSVTISSLSSNYGYAGMNVTIKGSGFGAADEEGTVFIGTTPLKGEVGGTESDYIKWTDTEIVVKLPAGLTVGQTTISVENQGVKSSSRNFTILADIPEAAAEIMATSIDKETVHIKYTASPTETYGDVFDGYILRVMRDVSIVDSVVVDGSTNPIEVTGLEEATRYTFELYTRYDNGMESEAKSIQWAPAFRFNDVDAQEIRVYETASTLGSGLEIFNDDDGFPRVRRVVEGGNWNLGLYTRDGALDFGSASQIDYEFTGTPIPTYISNQAAGIKTLDEWFLSAALDSPEHNYSEMLINLKDYEGTDNGLGMIVRYMKEGSDKYNYAKVLLLTKDGNFLQNDGGDDYIVVQVSFQTGEGIPYAKVK